MYLHFDKNKLQISLHKTLRWARIGVQIIFLLSVFFVVVYRWLNPFITPLMVIRFFDQIVDGRQIVFDKDRVNIEDVAPSAIYAVVAGEDNNFVSHGGFDRDALYKAMEYDIKNKTISLGGSTISQQTAKNVFLWPGRDFLRKGLEAYFTLMIETFRDKKRILEVYMNVVEFGDGVYGIQAAAQKYFHIDAKYLSYSQAALLSAMLPNPRYYEDHLSSYWLLRRKGHILNIIGNVKSDADTRAFVKDIKN